MTGKLTPADTGLTWSCKRVWIEQRKRENWMGRGGKHWQYIKCISSVKLVKLGQSVHAARRGKCRDEYFPSVLTKGTDSVTGKWKSGPQSPDEKCSRHCWWNSNYPHRPFTEKVEDRLVILICTRSKGMKKLQRKVTSHFCLIDITYNYAQSSRGTITHTTGSGSSLYHHGVLHTMDRSHTSRHSLN